MKAFDYFLELTKIPRGSYNEEQVAKYVCEFAKLHNLKYEMDEFFNVKVFKDNHSAKTIILQAHLDMVCEKNCDVDFSFEKDAINTSINGDFISANGTTLGADDGFGVSLILEILEKCGEDYPNIEAIFTTQEETSMGGAKNVDCSNLKGRHLIGLDGTCSNEVIIGCAGSDRVLFEKEIEYETDLYAQNLNNSKRKRVVFEYYDIKESECVARAKNKFKLSVSGLLGGHSGEDIDKNRVNANKLGFDLLGAISSEFGASLISVCGGGKDNAIPREIEFEFLTSATDNELGKFISNYKFNFSIKATHEFGADIRYTQIQEKFIDAINAKKQANKEKVLTKESTKEIIKFVSDFPNGVISKSDEAGVLCSINLAKVELVDGKFKAYAMLRYNTKDLAVMSHEKYNQFANDNNFDVIYTDYAPFFEATKDNELIEICQTTYNELAIQDLNNKDLNICQIHAGLEGGVFASKIKDLKVVVLGADLYDIHSPKEKMKISSLEKLSNWLDLILKKFNA